MKRKKTLSMVLSAVLAAGMLTGCGGAGNSTRSGDKKDITLKVLTQRTDIVDTDLKAFSDKYTEKTGVKIKWEAIKDYESDIKVRLNSNDYGDVLLLPSTMPKNEYPNFFEPLGKASDTKISEYQSNKLSATRDGDDFIVYGLSYGVGAQGIVYNKTAFKAVGVDAANVKTLDQFYDTCEKIKAAGIIPIATNFNDKWPLSNWYANGWVLSGDGNFPNKLYKEKSVFEASKPLGQSLEILYNLVSKGWTEEDLTTTNWEQSKSDLASGKLAMMSLGTWSIPQLKAMAKNPDDIGFMAIPTKEGKTFTLLSPDYALGVSNKSTNKDAAKEFLYAFIDSDYAINNGYIPNNKNIKVQDKTLQDFLDSGVTKITQEPAEKEDDGKFDLTYTKAKIDIWGGTFAQAPALAAKKSRADFDKTLQDLNDAWNKSKEAQGFN